MLAIAAAVMLHGDLGSGPFGRDFEAYYAAGATWNAGGDPYGRDIWQVERTIPGVDARRDEVLPYVGPAAALPLWSLFARLPFRPARALWETLLGAALVALVLAALALAGAGRSPAIGATALALGACSGPVVSAFALGQAALVGAAATIVAFSALERGGLGAVPAIFLAAIQPNLALPLAVRVFDRRALAMLAAAAAAFTALTLAAGGGPAGLAGYADRLRQHGNAERYITIQHTLPAIAASFGAPHALADALGLAASMLAVAIVAVAAARWQRRPAAAAALAVALLPFVVPFFHEHDFAIELFPAIWLLRAGDPRVRAVAGSAAVMTLVDWFGLAQRPGAVDQTLALAVAVAAAAALLGPRDAAAATPAGRWATAAPLLTALALMALCVPVARAFTAPTWPEALGAFHAAAGLDVSTVWRDEQRQAGLEAAVGAWGLLRAVPLLGCLLFAAATLRRARGYAMKMVPSRTVSATRASDAP